MHDDNNLKIASWVVARLNGTIQQEEEKMLEEWIHESDEHRLFYERLVERNYLMGRLQEYENYSLEALKERVMFSVGKQGKRIRLIRRVKQIAAILLIPLIAGSVFLFMMEKEEISPLATDIIPGKECAVLEMADGRKLELGLGKNLGQLQLEGTVVTNDSNRLAYKQGHSGNPSALEYNTIIIPRGGEYQLILSDGSRVWLNSDTRLRYPVSFIGEKREVYLEGEAYFEIAENKKSPFQVLAENVKIQVTGTCFNVKAYASDKVIKTTLDEGSINIGHVQSRRPMQQMLPGQTAVYEKRSNVIKIKTDRYHDDASSWKSNRLIFRNASLKEVLTTLSRHFDIEITIKNEKIASFTYDFVCKGNDLNYVLEVMQSITPVSFKKISEYTYTVE